VNCLGAKASRLHDFAATQFAMHATQQICGLAEQRSFGHVADRIVLSSPARERIEREVEDEIVHSFFWACIFFFAASCFKAEVQGRLPAGDLLTRDDYTVYSAVIKEAIVHDKSAVAWIHNVTNRDLLDGFYPFQEGKLNPMTLDDKDAHIRQKVPGLQQSTVSDYLSKNTRALALNRRFKLPVAYVLANDQAQEKHRRLYRAGRASEMAWLSSAGFNAQHDQALVNLQTSGGTDGESTYYLLTKADHGWKVVARFAN